MSMHRPVDVAVAIAAAVLATFVGYWLNWVPETPRDPETSPAANARRAADTFRTELAHARQLGFEGEEAVDIDASGALWTDTVSLDADECVALVALSRSERVLQIRVRPEDSALSGAHDERDLVQHVQLCAPRATTVRVEVDGAGELPPRFRLATLRATVSAVGGEARLDRPSGGRYGWDDASRLVHERALAVARDEADDSRTRSSSDDAVALLPRTDASCAALGRLFPHLRPRLGEGLCPTLATRGGETGNRTAMPSGVVRVLAVVDPEAYDGCVRVETRRLLLHHRAPPVGHVEIPVTNASPPRVISRLSADEEGAARTTSCAREVFALTVPARDEEVWSLRVTAVEDRPLEGSPRPALVARGVPLTPAEACDAGDGEACGLAGFRVARRTPLVAERFFERGCELEHGRSCAALAIRRDDSVELFARGCFAGYATACESAIFHGGSPVTEWRFERLTTTRLELVGPPPIDARIPRLGDEVPSRCALITHPARQGQVVCGGFGLGRWGSESNHNLVHYVNIAEGGAQLYGKLPWTPPRGGARATFFPEHGRALIVPRSAAGLPASEPTEPVAGELPREGILILREHDEPDRVVWMDLASRRTVLWFDDLPVAELHSLEE